MATAKGTPRPDTRPDLLSGTPRAHALDRWIYVVTAMFFILITLTGFIPDSMMKIAMVKAGQRPPFPLILHLHALLMGSFLLFLLAQTWLVATGRVALHRRIGPIGGLLAITLVVVGFALAPTMYRQVWDGLQTAPPAAQGPLRELNLRLDNILLLQLRVGVLFPLFLFLGLRARNRDSGFHKRMMMIAPAMALPAAFDRISWLPQTFPANPLSTDLYPLLALAPLFLWDVIRNRRVHEAYWLFLAVYVPACVLVHLPFDTPWWHETARWLMGV